MDLLRKILFPLAVLYGWVTQLRNFLFDTGVFKSHIFNLPVIAVGNLSVGGTGKTPQIEYLIRLLSPHYKIATLSRGYKRHTQGFVLADENATPASIGDEPFQFYQKFPEILVAVDADRKNGIENLLKQKSKPDVILLDDAFQHRKVKAGFYILLTAYGDLFADDYMLPAGNLRESRSGAKRADVVIVTKCPPDLSADAQNKIRKKLKIYTAAPLFFTSIVYDDKIYSKDKSILVSDIKNTEKVLLAGIAKPKPFFSFLQNERDKILEFPDHHHFSSEDLNAIQGNIQNRIIVTTEKDYVRLNGKIDSDKLFYLPIATAFVNGQAFDKAISGYIINNL